MKMDIMKSANERDQKSYAQKKTDQGCAIIQVAVLRNLCVSMQSAAAWGVREA